MRTSHLPRTKHQDHHTMGSFLVFMQFGLLLLLAAMASGAVQAGAIPIPAWVMAGMSVLLALWTLAHNRPGNFNIRPLPKQGGRLIMSGPYRHVRHPMYSAVLLGALALAWLSGPLAWLAWVALWAVLWHKSSLEEHGLEQQHPDYAAYRRHSRRFLPWLL
jgi:protein-S-isoprenylcysteine O-methyltransferase Ste14